MNTEIQQLHTDIHTQESVSASVLEKITDQSLTPVPKWRFLVVEYGVWFTWGLSIILGAVAFSVVLFFLSHAPFIFYEVSHDSILDLLIDVFPQAWLLVFVGMGIFAHYNLRHTKYGYKYRLWQVLLSSILFSCILGVMLHIVGTGIIVDKMLGNKMPFFEDFKHTQMRIWQMPQEGRIIGTVLQNNQQLHIAQIADSEGRSWQLDTTALNPFDIELLMSGDEVHIIGIASSTQAGYFYGCAVLPRMPDMIPPVAQMRIDRDRFINRMKEYQEMETPLFIEGEREEGIKERSICGRHEAVLRVQGELMP